MLPTPMSGRGGGGVVWPAFWLSGRFFADAFTSICSEAFLMAIEVARADNIVRLFLAFVGLSSFGEILGGVRLGLKDL